MCAHAVDSVKHDQLDNKAVRGGVQEYIIKLASVQAKGDKYEVQLLRLK